MANKNINSVGDAIARINASKPGDYAMTRVLTLNVPAESPAASIIGAAIKLMDANIDVSDDETKMTEGKYEIVTVFHVRRISHSDILLH